MEKIHMNAFNKKKTISILGKSFHHNMVSLSPLSNIIKGSTCTAHAGLRSQHA